MVNLSHVEDITLGAGSSTSVIRRDVFNRSRRTSRQKPHLGVPPLPNVDVEIQRRLDWAARHGWARTQSPDPDQRSSISAAPCIANHEVSCTTAYLTATAMTITNSVSRPHTEELAINSGHRSLRRRRSDASRKPSILLFMLWVI